MSSNPPLWLKALARRRVLQGGGALLGAGVLSGCAAPSTTGTCDDAPDALDAALAATPDLTPDLTGLPYRKTTRGGAAT
jgi:hypothetical protein